MNSELYELYRELCDQEGWIISRKFERFIEEELNKPQNKELKEQALKNQIRRQDFKIQTLRKFDQNDKIKITSESIRNTKSIDARDKDNDSIEVSEDE